MNRQPIPTLRQHEQMRRINLAPYLKQQAELEVERAARSDAALQVDAFLCRVAQPEPANFCAAVDRPSPLLHRIHSALLEEFGVLWPMYAAVFVGLWVGAAALTGLYFWVQP